MLDYRAQSPATESAAAAYQAEFWLKMPPLARLIHIVERRTYHRPRFSKFDLRLLCDHVLEGDYTPYEQGLEWESKECPRTIDPLQILHQIPTIIGSGWSKLPPTTEIHHPYATWLFEPERLAV